MKSPLRHLEEACHHIDELAAISKAGTIDLYEGRLLDALLEDLRECYHPIGKRSVSTTKLMELVQRYCEAKSLYFDQLVLRKEPPSLRDTAQSPAPAGAAPQKLLTRALIDHWKFFDCPKCGRGYVDGKLTILKRGPYHTPTCDCYETVEPPDVHASLAEKTGRVN